MSRVSEVARRYAQAFFEEVPAGNSKDVLAEIRALREAFAKEPAVAEFFKSPVVPASAKEEVLKKTFAEQKVSASVREFVTFLASRDRLEVFSDSVEAFEKLVDNENGVVRGNVQSAEVLSTQERAEVEKLINKNTGKKVILNYSENPGIMGGLIAQVGSLTFDDTLSSHLKRLKEELKKRRVH